MTSPDLARWRDETAIVDLLVDGLLARDGQAQAAAVGAIPDDDGAHARVWARVLMLVSWHAAHGPD